MTTDRMWTTAPTTATPHATIGGRASGPVRPPASSDTMIDRPRLIERVSAALEESPLVLLRAPAGYGKTALAAAWAHGQVHRRRPVAWLSLTERYGEPVIFWSHVLTALAFVGALGTELPAALPDSYDIDELAELILLAPPVVLVLDAAERIRGRMVFADLARLLAILDGQLRVVMTTRADPPMPLHRYRLEGTLAEIRYDELAFTESETSAVLRAHKVSDPTQAMSPTLDEIEGWPAGVRLAALALQHRQPALRLSDAVAGYLAAEVFDGLAAADRDLLMRLSVVEELPPGLAPALTDRLDADEQIKRMSAANTFVLISLDRPGFRIHPAVRQFLAGRLAQSEPEAVTDLHGRAADWYATQRELRFALTHTVAIGDWERAAGFVLSCGGLADLLQGPSADASLATTLAAMPDLDDVDVQLVLAAVAVGERRPAAARGHLSRGEPAGRSDLGPELAGGCPCQEARELSATLIRVCLGELSGEVEETLRAADRVWTLLSGDVRPTEPHAERLRALVLHAEGSARWRIGEFDDGCRLLRRAVAVASSVADDRLRGRSLAGLALAEACRGHLSAVPELVETLDASGPVPLAGWLAQAWVAIERQELARGRDALASAARLRDRDEDDLLESIGALLRARLLRDRGDLAGARHLLAGMDLPSGWLGPLFRSEAAAIGVPVDVAGLRSAPNGSAAEQIYESVAFAQADGLAGDLAGARVALARALSAAEAERLRRPFAHLGPETRALLRKDRELQARARWLQPEPAEVAGARGAAAQPDPIRVELSARELEVLCQLGELLTTEEIAAQLFISVNTVRTHVRRILEKLGVSRRYEAVRRGRELGLL